MNNVHPAQIALQVWHFHLRSWVHYLSQDLFFKLLCVFNSNLCVFPTFFCVYQLLFSVHTPGTRTPSALDGFWYINIDTVGFVETRDKPSCYLTLQVLSCVPPVACGEANMCNTGYGGIACANCVEDYFRSEDSLLIMISISVQCYSVDFVCHDMTRSYSATWQAQASDDFWYFRTEGLCKPCPGWSGIILIAVVLAAVATSIGCLLLVRSGFSFGPMVIFFNFAQVITLFNRLSTVWPSSLSQLMGKGTGLESVISYRYALRSYIGALTLHFRCHDNFQLVNGDSGASMCSKNDTLVCTSDFCHFSGKQFCSLSPFQSSWPY